MVKVLLKSVLQISLVETLIVHRSLSEANLLQNLIFAGRLLSALTMAQQF